MIDSNSAKRASAGRKAVVIGLTGGTATGKSTLARILRGRGAACYCVDEVAHVLYEPGGPAWRRVLRSFGSDIAGPDGAIDRARLGTKAFASSRNLGRLESILHPLMRRLAGRAVERMRRANGLVVVEAGPLLFRLGLDRHVDLIVLTECPSDLRIRRMCRAKGLSPAQARARLRVMRPAEESLARRAGRVSCVMHVCTGGPPAAMLAAAERILAWAAGRREAAEWGGASGNAAV